VTDRATVCPNCGDTVTDAWGDSHTVRCWVQSGRRTVVEIQKHIPIPVTIATPWKENRSHSTGS